VRPGEGERAANILGWVPWTLAPREQAVADPGLDAGPAERADLDRRPRCGLLQQAGLFEPGLTLAGPPLSWKWQPTQHGF